MNKNKIIMFIGPMGVGKSTIAQQVGEKMKMPVVSLDELMSYMKMIYQFRGLPSFEVWKNTQEFVFKDTLDEQSFIKNKKAIDEKIIDGYKKLNTYNDLFNLTSLFNEYYVMQRKLNSCDVYDGMSAAFLNNYCELEFLDVLLNNLNKSVILDSFGGIGSILEAPCDMYIGGSLIKKGENCEELQERVLKRIGTKIFIAPGRGYEERYHDTGSKIVNDAYFVNPDSFYKYADIFIPTNDLFVDSTNEIFKQQRDDYDLESSQKVKDLLNAPEFSHICNEIVESINNLDKARDMRIL